MNFSGIKIPDELLQAQDNEEFVIFAGAGVSKNSGFPDFEKLVEKAEIHFEGFVNDDKTVPLEIRLGDLQRAGHDLHRFVFGVFSNAPSDHLLHKNILGLFQKSQRIKLVTTNFDHLFETACVDIGIDCRNYSAPALPRGDRFDGIVHVHGSTYGIPEDLVLTDQDFGRAYLTEGWARRFIVSLFQNNHVLFYGYKHGEQVLRYLARALPPSSKRYAFSTAERASGWSQLGVKPIICDGNDAYQRQKSCICEWSDWLSRSHSWMEERIASIVRETAPPTAEEADLIETTLKDSRVRYFTRHAVTPDWFRWLLENGVLDAIFEHHTSLSDVQVQLADWAAQQFALDESNALLQAAIDHNQQVNPVLWQAIVSTLFRSQDRPDPLVLRSWVTLLLHQVPKNVDRLDGLGILMEKCNWEADKVVILRLFSFLLEPVPESVTASAFVFRGEGPRLEYSLTLRGEEYILGEAWGKIRPHLEECWQVLQPTAQKYLTDAYFMNLSFKKAEAEHDPQSFWRSAIEPHEQDENSHRSFDVLIDVARDVLCYLHQSHVHSELADQLTDYWYATGVPLLQRVAIHAKSQSDCESDKKIAWVADRGLIFKSYAKHEVWQLLRGAIPRASATTTRTLLEIIDTKKPSNAASANKNDLEAYERYLLLNWLVESAPANEILSSALDEAQMQHPKFKPREYPDFDHWSGGVELIEPHSPKQQEKLSEIPITKLVSYLIEFKPDDPEDWHDQRLGLMQQLEREVTQSFDWSMELALVLVESKAEDKFIWDGLLGGWEKSELSDDQVVEVAHFLTNNARVHQHTQAGARWLQVLLEKERAFGLHILNDLEELSDTIWTVFEATVEEPEYRNDSWLHSAINEGPGWLTEFWLHALNRRVRNEESKTPQMPLDYDNRFRKVLKSSSFSAQLGRCILASRIHFLAFVDLDWTRRQIIPLLDFNMDRLTAEQAWHGYLTWGRPRIEIIESLKPLMPAALNHLHDTQEKFRKRLVEIAADIVIVDRSHQPDRQWLYDLMRGEAISADERGIIVSRIKQTLRQSESNGRTALWNRWLRDYWQDRIDGSPVPMSEQEGDQFLELPLYLEDQFEDAIEMVLKTRVFRFEITHLFFELERNSNLIEKHPKLVARWIAHILKSQKQYSHHYYHLQPIYEKLKARLDKNQLLPLTEELVRLLIISAVDPA